LFNMTSDSDLFEFEQSENNLPLYEAKMIHQFDHRWAKYEEEANRDCTVEEKKNSDFEITPRYWVSKLEVDEQLRTKHWDREWLMGWRDITNVTNERTVIFSVIPKSAVGHNCPLIFLDYDLKKWTALFANLNSIPFDFIARQKIGGTHLTYGYLKQFPNIPLTSYSESDLNFIIPRVLELTYTSHAMEPFARDLGYDGAPFKWDEERRALLRAELDAWYANAYGLTRDELRYILDPADVMGADYPSETFRVLKEREIKVYGEYRTQRLVLEAWDKMYGERKAA